MILSTHGIVGSQIVQAFDVDAQAFFDRVTTAGGTLSSSEKNAVNTLVIKMKNDGIWTKMKAIYPMVGASAEACKQNLKSSSFTGSFSSGWTFSSNGVTGNGTGAYMDTGLNANTSLNINSAHISYYRNTINSAIGLGVLMGINDLSLFLQPTASNFYGSLATTNINDFSGSFNTTGFFIVNRPSSTTQKTIRNTTIVQTKTVTGSSYASSQNVFLSNYNTASTFATNSRCAFSSIGDGLTDTEASNFYTSVQAFQTTLSRQV